MATHQSGNRRDPSHYARLLLALLLLHLPHTSAMVIQRVFGANGTEVGFASAGGGTHVYLAGTDIGSAFAPPEVYVGIRADARCVVQPFTSSRNRLHCIVNAEGLPPPDVAYSPAHGTNPTAVPMTYGVRRSLVSPKR